MKIDTSARFGAPEAPLYVRVARELRDDITSGRFPVGSLLPTEDQLCRRFSVSRYTVREGLRILREDGLVNSRRGAGTMVIPPRAFGSDIHQVMSINDLLAFGEDTRLDIESISTVALNRRQAARTGLPRNSEWLALSGHRHPAAGGVPVCQAEYYINRAFASVGRLLQRHQGPIFPLIEDMFGQSIVEVHQQISAVLISPTLARVLNASEGAAALEVRRSYRLADDRIAQVTINTHPASRYQHSMTMRRIRG